ncbi:MAG: OmpA family protein [Candidatus Palauibacterales bacterium]|nr:OmpA family protein [Candidatus Palauibacterales bacterium]MDP2528911.1 OmpA family protein [Candidatus Palauibacterales bacterium]MDP2584047.1 OmpA family protein [Candidatus Palauibacterales bacterium]
MRRFVIVVVAALALAAGAAACGESSGRASRGPDGTPSSSVPASSRSSHPAAGSSDTSLASGESPAPAGSGASADLQDMLGSMGSAIDEADECGLWTARARRAGGFSDTASSPLGLRFETGLEVVEAEHGFGHDYEWTTRVTQADSESVTFMAGGRVPLVRRVTRDSVVPLGRDTTDTYRRRVFRQDLTWARCLAVNYYIFNGEVNAVQGVTWEAMSRSLFTVLRRGEPVAIGRANEPDPDDWTRKVTFVGTLAPVDSGPRTYQVVLDDSLVEVPSLVARGTLQHGDATESVEITFLDDPAMPLVLSTCCTRGGGRVVRISRPLDPARMERTLEKKRTLVLYRVHFPFASDSILPGSGPVLEAIAGIMRKHSDWRLSVTGHTDSIGTEGANLELSRRRARAVKAALVHILGPAAAARLTTSGSGESSPLAENGTLEGRAANRRVEVRRE